MRLPSGLMLTQRTALVAAQGADFLARVEVPEFDGLVEARGRQYLAARMIRDGGSQVPSGLPEERLPGGQVPDLISPGRVLPQVPARRHRRPSGLN